jgi:hypothetical protein
LAQSGRFARWEQRAAVLADSLTRRKYFVLLLFSTLYFIATCFRAHRKLFWFDELFTLYLSRLPSAAALWDALIHGADFNPPLFYLFSRLATPFFGDIQVALRLPEIVGFWVLCLCLFRFVSVRTSVLAGVIAMLFPLLTTAYFYAYEARPHGIVIGFAGIALVCWQAAAYSSRRTGWLVGLFSALSLAILTHTYAILLIAPFALGEASRAWLLRRIDWKVWLAILTPSLGSLLSLPLWRAAKGTLPGTFFPAKLSALSDSYRFHLAPALGVLVAFLVLSFLYSVSLGRQPENDPGGRSFALPKNISHEIPPHEIVVLLSFVALPVFSYFLSKLTGAPFFNRYTSSMVAGFGCLLGIMAAKRLPVGVVVLFFLVAQIGFNLIEYWHAGTVNEPTLSLALSTRMDQFEAKYEMMRAAPGKSSPIVLFDGLKFLPIMQYAPPDIAPRLVYAAPESDANALGYTNLQRCCRPPGRLETISALLAARADFLAFCNSATLLRLSPLLHQGADVTVESVSVDEILFTVTFAKNRP